MMKGNSDEKILSYNDVVLRKSDLGILGGPYFLNDQIIEFYFSYLSTCCPSDDILLVPPSMTFWIMNCPAAWSLEDFLEPLHLPDKTLVIFPINDNDDVSKAGGGFHWSLLAFERKANVFVHHDSCGSMNKIHARRLYNAVARYMGFSNSAIDASFIESTDSPQQKNWYDCGLYVIGIAKVICNWHLNHRYSYADGLWFSALKEQITPSAIAGSRSEILALIRDLIARANLSDKMAVLYLETGDCARKCLI
ncbi:NEDD8-specific protease 1 [Quillaja saponaria]|uniref:NEDD8-specific protease 1 n=1 Tax=Quillaja saponaria TaxID=32244 RepID=A0AAD7PAI8_QUISA|nr:NEDD8-specific protease 1 [Quillaja saponaria]